jgi:DNA-binding beta-propeller fold protein YncE
VAVADQYNHRVQIFDSEGNYKRQFGTEGMQADGQLQHPTDLASDAHGNLLVVDGTNRLQVFDHEGKHLCTRSDLGLGEASIKGIAWSASGEIAVVAGKADTASVWHSA